MMNYPIHEGITVPPIKNVVIPEMKKALAWELRSAVAMCATLLTVAGVAVFAYVEYFSSGTIPPLTITGITLTLMLALAFTISDREQTHAEKEVTRILLERVAEETGAKPAGKFKFLNGKRSSLNSMEKDGEVSPWVFVADYKNNVVSYRSL